MSKLTKTQIKEIQIIIDKMERANKILYSDKITVCKTENKATTNLHYTRNADDKIIYEINKEVGSEICFYNDCLSKLKYFISVR